MEESGEHVCDLCKVTYASESELDDHNWSLMHHIKVEKIKKGAPHSCNLCMLTCSNLIDYGKHLNEDRHKLALSRRAKEGNEMLDSFAGSGNIFEAETKNDRNLQPDQKEKPRSLLDMPLPAQFAHSQMFNESFMQNQFGPSSYPAHFDYQPANWQEFLDISQGQGPSWKGNSRGGQRDQMIGDGHGEGKGRFKVPRGRGRGHQRTHSDIHPREIPVSFYEDDFQGVNWNDHHFYSDSYGDRQMKDEFPWNDTGRGRSGRDKRRGSFDSTFTRNDRGYPAETSSPELKNWDGSDPRETPERGRGILRDGRYHRRSRSYENISPESNSSSDSSLKRRRENEDQVGLTQPERSRRRIIAPDQYASSSSGYQSGRSSRLMEDRSNHRPRSRSTSQDRSLSLRESRSETESEGKAKSVSWSDQQQVSSTSEKQEEERKVRKSHYGQSRPDTGMNGQDQRDVRGYRKARTAIEEKQTILPDSSSDLEEKKRTNINMMKSRNKAGARRNQSPKGERKGVATGDNTESILEKAEKLCQKLRSEREQASKKKKSEEKIKKMEKETELNKKLETLAEMNKSNIRGVLDMEMSAPLGSRPELPVSASNSDVLDSLSSSDTGSSVKAAGTLSRKVTAEKPYAVQRARNESQEVAERIARTKADIDSIRAKIESSVQNEMSGQKVSAPSAEMSIPPTRYPASTDQSALVKMVNSPRTPKEKLSLAQMLREHAKSQTKFSLQRFNLKYSDLCSGVGEKGDEYTNINVDQLDTNSILEIANLIELDIKPDIGYLEQLLDKASVENVVLDEAVLSNLGIQGGSAVKSKASPSPSSVQHGTMSPNRTQSPVRRNIHSDYAEREIKTTNEKITRHRSRSPISEKNNREQQMPPPRREHFLGEQYESPSFHTGVPAPQRVLDLDDLRSTRGRKSPSPIPGKAAIDEHGNRFSSSLPISNPPLTNGSQLSSSTSSITPLSANIRIKQEKEDNEYNQALRDTKERGPISEQRVSKGESPDIGQDRREGRSRDNMSESQDNIEAQGRFSPVQRSVHTRNLYNDDFLVREPKSRSHEQTVEGKDCSEMGYELSVKSVTVSAPSQQMPCSASEQVSRILSSVPAPDVDSQRASGAQKGHSEVQRSQGQHKGARDGGGPVFSLARMAAEEKARATVSCVPEVERPIRSSSPNPAEKDKPLDSSVNSQASILDEVYRMSLHEENMRSQISTVDLKISKLRSLIEEASQQLDIFSDEKRQLEKQEKSCRTKRIKLLEESRSSSACSQTGAGGLPSYLASQYSDNPVFMKFLMSRQSDVSSIGGFSNVESGSQPDSDVQAQRRGSFTSNVSEPNSAGDLNARENPASPLFSKSLDVLTGSTETITSSKSKGFEFSSSETSTPRASNEQKPKEDPHNDEVWTNDALNSNNTVSFINTPGEKVGFVTLEALMKGDTDIGKMLNKSIESIEKGVIPEGASPLQSPLHKQSSNESNVTGVGGTLRERRDSSFSIGSEGSDSEKRKVSMKYMGTLPGGMNYEAFVKQMSEENKNKNIMFTVFNSPDAVSQQLLKKTPDAEIKTPGHSKPSLLSSTPGETGYKSDTNTSTRTLTDCGEEHSVISLGEQIMRLCDGQRGEESSNLEMITPRSGTDTFDDITPRVLSKERQGTPERNLKLNGTLLQEMRDSPVKDCSIALERIDVADSSAELLKLLEGSGPYTKPASGARSQSPIIIGEAPSPVRKRLKSKKERDQQSRRKQKESFILQSDTNSENETEGITQRTKLLAKWTQSEEDLCQSGSEERTPRILPGQSEILPSIAEMSVVKKSLLDEVQLETETPSDSCEDRSQQLLAQHETIPSIHYKGASLSVACMQVFNDDLYVCYNGSEIRRFDLKTGQVLKELDCSPYLVNCMHIVNVEDRGGVLYTGGACRKLMLFTPEKFNLISTYDYGSRLTCLHSNWGRLFIAFTDGNVSCRSLKTDKELNSFTCTTSPVHAMVSTSAGMTKMLCLATGDKAIYVLDAFTGLLITMLEGHTRPPLCLQVNGEFVISGGTDKAIAVHSVTSGELLQLALIQIPVTNLYCHDNRIYSLCGDSTLRTFGMNLRAEGRHEMDRVLTSVLVANGYLLVGNREGLVTGQCMDRLLPYVCKFGSCRQQFRTTEDIKLHVISEHTMIANLSHCDYLGCDHKFRKDERKKDHMLQHLHQKMDGTVL